MPFIARQLVPYGTYPEDQPISSIKRILNDNEIAFGYRIGYLFNQWTGPVYRWSAAELNLQRPEFATLFCCAHLPDCTATDVVQLTSIPKNTISRAVARLMADGLVERKAHEADARKAVLRMTREGRKVYQQMLPQFVARQQRMLSVLDKAELKELDRLLDKLVERDDDWAADA